MDAMGGAGRLDRRGVADVAGLLTGRVLPSDATGLAELLTGLEELKATAAAVQARASVVLADLLVAEQRAQQVPARRLGRGVSAAVAFARRESPAAGDMWLGFARALVHEMPHTMRLLETGVLSEARALVLVRESACLSLGDRQALDQELCVDADRIATLGSRQLQAEAMKVAYRLDPHAIVKRHAKAVKERKVTLRPAPDAMTYLTALLPLEQGVSCLKALGEAASTARAAGDERSRGQVMADTLVQRVTGQATAEAVALGVLLVVSEGSLFDGACEPAVIPGFGPINAAHARLLVARAAGDEQTVSWLRRLYRQPATGDLVGLDSRSRSFPAGLALLITARDQVCRTPWCDAPVRHIDHLVPHAEGGPTSYGNGQGLCEACNHAKQAPGWDTLPRPGPHAPIEVTTPTGQTRCTRAPTPPGPPVPTRRVEMIWPTGIHIDLPSRAA